MEYKAKGATGIGCTGCSFMDMNFFRWKIEQEISDFEKYYFEIEAQIDKLEEKMETTLGRTNKEKIRLKIRGLHDRQERISEKIKKCQEDLIRLEETGLL